MAFNSLILFTLTLLPPSIALAQVSPPRFAPAPLRISTSIPITNAGFESFFLADGYFVRECCSSCGGMQILDPNPIPGWTYSSCGGQGTRNPTSLEYPNQIGHATEGVNVAWSQWGAPFVQTVGERLRANAKYILQVDVGRPIPSFKPWGGYIITLRTSSQVLAQLSESPASTSILAGGFKTLSLVYYAGYNDPALGELLIIELSCNGNQAGKETGFDNVRLTRREQLLPVQFPIIAGGLVLGAWGVRSAPKASW